MAIPELDDLLYRIEVLRLEQGQYEDLFEAEECPSPEAVFETNAIIPETTTTTSELPRSESISTTISTNVRSGSTSAISHATSVTSRSSSHDGPAPPPERQSASFERKSLLQMSHLTTTDYGRFVAHAEQSLKRVVRGSPLVSSLPMTTSSLFMSARKPYASLRRRFTHFSKSSKDKRAANETRCCTRCRSSAKTSRSLQCLPCGHSYCDGCLRALFLSAIENAKVVPLTCCKSPLPRDLVESLLSRDEQLRFVGMILRVDGDRGGQASCSSCGLIMEGKENLESDSDLGVQCGTCISNLCRTCIREAHAVGRSCPAEWALDVLRQLDKDQCWIRCNYCKRMLGFREGSIHITCHCKTEICCASGSEWIPPSDHINTYAPRTEVSEVVQESSRGDCVLESADVTHILAILEAAARSNDNRELQELRVQQSEEQTRFLAFEQKQKRVMRARHGQCKVGMLDRHVNAEQTMKRQHLERVNAMEDRHVSAEMELRQGLAQEQKACSIRLRHMVGYCETINKKSNNYNGDCPHAQRRKMTERDIRELHQQYKLRDDMDRMHEARINVMRDKQARQLEAFEKRQQEELEALSKRHASEVDALDTRFATDTSEFETLFARRKDRLMMKWAREEERIRSSLSIDTGDEFGPLPAITWPLDGPR